MAKAKRQHTFPCGHRGRGQICHRCQQEALAKQAAQHQAADRQQQRQTWQAKFDLDPIDLRGLPRHVVEKARSILQDLQQGEHFKTLKGKRMIFDRTVIRIPVGHRYRLLCREHNGQLLPWRVISHEEYNAYASNKRPVG
ncbi:hypothetical protein GFS31_25610 [Leptolyngbya sp. BL0902]|uniref:DUF7682 family zinc-binding protein n=1 Tax=Leptolyngbya sp. BL0902 TaxID=1115757 RepID=UPI0018E8FAD2|nr:hypothetical protein [Leptolyngbya sp. BL0902]QQE65869.1 hypothetical protein GFS31_25610 [Leptolyngbya sp. BL0902]